MLLMTLLHASNETFIAIMSTKSCTSDASKWTKLAVKKEVMVLMVQMFAVH